jgi:hypothetical protein
MTSFQNNVTVHEETAICTGPIPCPCVTDGKSIGASVRKLRYHLVHVLSILRGTLFPSPTELLRISLESSGRFRSLRHYTHTSTAKCENNSFLFVL